MTRSAYSPPAPYTIAGTGPYPTEFPYLGSAEVVVLISSGDDPLVQLTLGVDFTVSPEVATTNGDVTLSAGAATTYAGDSLIIRRATQSEQGWAAQRGPREAGLELQLDRTIQVLQEQVADLARAIKLPVGTPSDIPVGWAGKFLWFDLSGNPVPVETIDALPISAFIETLIDDPDAATARNTLGLGSIALQPNSQLVVGSDQIALNAVTVNTAGHLDDDNDGGVTIKSFVPHLAFLDRTVGGGSMLIIGTESGGIRIKGDSGNDGTIGKPANLTDYELFRAEYGTTTFYVDGSSAVVLDASGMDVQGRVTQSESRWEYVSGGDLGAAAEYIFSGIDLSSADYALIFNKFKPASGSGNFEVAFSTDNGASFPKSQTLVPGVTVSIEGRYSITNVSDHILAEHQILSGGSVGGYADANHNYYKDVGSPDISTSTDAIRVRLNGTTIAADGRVYLIRKQH